MHPPVRPLGKQVANLLYQSWRAHCPAPQISEGELATITPLLLGSGAGALAWVRIRSSDLRESSSAADLHEAYRLHALHAAVFEDDLKGVVTVLRAAHVDPMLIKGWAVARLYPDTALRPYGDLDLCVRRAEYAAATAACVSSEGQKFVVDLDHGLDGYGFDDEHDLFENSQVVKLGCVDVRVPALEDSLRISCIHFLRHGAFRPLWLCDVALIVESTPADFDWDRCLGSNKRIADWIACAIGLAHQLLGARVDHTPVKRRAENLPSWLLPAVLKQWENPVTTDHGVNRHRAPMASYLRNPSGMFGDVLKRWPNPIEATVYTGGPFNELPRLPFQIGECLARTAKFIARLPQSMRKK